MHDRKAKLRDPRPVYLQLPPQGLPLRETLLLFRYSVVRADPAGSPNCPNIIFSRPHVETEVSTRWAVSIICCANHRAQPDTEPMKSPQSIILLTAAAWLTACAVTPEPAAADTLTRAEAKAAACPVSVLEAGATPQDCACVEDQLFKIGQKPGAIQYDPDPPQSEIGTSAGRRDIAIGLLRLEAFETCGLFDPDHIVSRNL